MASSVFLDTAYAVALVVEQDQYHTKARALAVQIKEEKLRLVTTRSVLIEIGNYLAKAHRRDAGIAFLEQIERDPAAEIVPVTEDLFRAAFAPYKERRDKEWGLTDCTSFVVMHDVQGIESESSKEDLTPRQHCRYVLVRPGLNRLRRRHLFRIEQRRL